MEIRVMCDITHAKESSFNSHIEIASFLILLFHSCNMLLSCGIKEKRNGENVSFSYCSSQQSGYHRSYQSGSFRADTYLRFWFNIILPLHVPCILVVRNSYLERNLEYLLVADQMGFLSVIRRGVPSLTFSIAELGVSRYVAQRSFSGQYSFHFFQRSSCCDIESRFNLAHPKYSEWDHPHANEEDRCSGSLCGSSRPNKPVRSRLVQEGALLRQLCQRNILL